MDNYTDGRAGVLTALAVITAWYFLAAVVLKFVPARWLSNGGEEPRADATNMLVGIWFFSPIIWAVAPLALLGAPGRFVGRLLTDDD